MPDRLEHALASLAGEMAYPATPDLVPGVLERIALGPPRRRTWLRLARPLVLAVVLAVLLAAAVGALTLILPGLRLTVVPSLPATPTSSLGDALALGEPLPVDDDLAASGPSLLGPPSAAYVAQDGDVVSLVWAAGGDLPAIGDSDIGLIVQRIAGSLEPERIEKLVVEAGASVTRVEVEGNVGYWIEGAPHLVRYRAADGRERTEMTRLADEVLVWERGRTLYRVESASGLARTLRLAESMER